MQELGRRLRKLDGQNRERAKEAVLLEKVNTKQAEYATAAERLTGGTRSANLDSTGKPVSNRVG